MENNELREIIKCILYEDKNISKVCVITTKFPPYPKDVQILRGGVENGIEKIVKGLKSDGFDIFIISKDYIHPTNEEENVLRVGTYLPYSLEKNSLKRGLRFLFNETFNPITFIKIFMILKKENPEIIIVGDNRQMSLAHYFVAMILKIPFLIRYDWICPSYPKDHSCSLKERIWGCGNCFEDYFEIHMGIIPRTILGILSSLIFLIKIPIWNASQSVIAVNEFYKKLYVDWGVKPDKIKVISTSATITTKNLVNRGRFKKLTNDNSIILLYVGRLSLEKGIMLLIESFNSIMHDKLNLKLVIAGDGVLRENIITESKKNPKITFLGWLNKEELAELYDISQIVIVPSIVPEGHPRVVEEGIEFEKWIIGSNLGGVQEILENYDKGILVNHLNSNEFSRVILKVAKNV